MWLVKLALRNPYTMGVLAAFIFLMGGLAIFSMNIDIFPLIDIPVVNVLWNYPGLQAEEMENRVVFQAERGYTTTVNGITRMESRSIPGVGLIRIYLERGEDIGAAIAQITSSSMMTLRIMPPGIQPPTIVQFNASNVPVAQLSISSESIPEELLFDYAQNFVRMKLFTLEGLSTPAPYGGKSRQINVDVRPELLTARGLSPQDVVSTLGNSNIVIPAGDARIGPLDYAVFLNSSPATVKEFNGLPIRSENGRTVTLGEVAHIEDAFADPTSLVRLDGKRATFLNILKKADASTLAVVNELRDELAEIKATAPRGMNFKIDFDQSVFVRAAVKNVFVEAAIATFLVSVMILGFLGSLRSVFIVCTSIPLSIFCSVIALKLTGQTLNIMTLGGLSLAIGMLVDDATVEVENIHRNRQKEGDLTLAILRGASQVALPAIMSTLAICLVFSPITLLTGPARFLFAPMALAVVFAMLASYVLSRTLVPTLAKLLLPGDGNEEGEKPGRHVVPFPDRRARRKSAWRARTARWNTWREEKFEQLKDGYSSLLGTLLDNKPTVFLGLLAIFLISLSLPFFVIGRDFFPPVDAGLMKLHFRARSGLRIEQTEKVIAHVEERIRAVIPPAELRTVNSLVGVPLFYNLAFVPSDSVGPMDADIQIALEDKHRPTVEVQRLLRADLEKHFPGSVFYFQPADIMNMVLNFGQTSTVDVQVEGQNIEDTRPIAEKLRDQISGVPGATDVHVRQIFNYPALHLSVDRVRASLLGLTQKDVASNMLISLSSSSLYAPSFYLNPQNHVNYSVVAKVPLTEINSTRDLLRTPITPAAGGGRGGASASAMPGVRADAVQAFGNHALLAPAQMLGNLSTVATDETSVENDHTNVQREVDVAAGVENRDLGGVSADIQSLIDQLGKLPAGVRVSIQGQSQVMGTAFPRLGLGLILAIALVYMLMVILFQSWLDPFIVLTALPGAMIGIFWMLAATGTSINVVSLMGSIMAVGIATSNSILMVSFANDLRVEEDLDPRGAALEAGQTRLRPVIMTALAMVLGMLPMSLGLGEGGEQNAPLARAVIGGLLVATVVTLFVVPLVYSVLRQEMPRKMAIRREMAETEKRFDAEMEELSNPRGTENDR